MNLLVFLLVWIAWIDRNMSLRPVIGILSQPSPYENYQSQKYSYIQSSYIKDLEAAGALVVPLLYTWSNEILLNRLNSLDGLLLSGGGTNLRQTNTTTGFKEYTDYAIKSNFLIQQARKINDQGSYFPIWGTSLGFQQLFMAFTSYTSSLRLLKKLKGTQNIMRNIKLNENSGIQNKSKILSNMDGSLFEQLDKQELFYFNHNFGLLRKTFQKVKSIRKNWIAVGFNVDEDGNEFISMAESVKYPFFGVQFNPEKVAYDWNEELKIKRDFYQVEAQQYFMNFFINQVRKQKYFKKKQDSQYHDSANLLNQATIAYIGMDIYFFNNNMNSNKAVDKCIQKCVGDEQSFLDRYNSQLLLVLNMVVLCVVICIQKYQFMKVRQEYLEQMQKLRSKQK